VRGARLASHLVGHTMKAMPNRPAIIASLILTAALALVVALLLTARPTAVPFSTLQPPPAGTVRYPTDRQSRPDLGGPALTYGTTHFLIHYTIGDNAPPATDADANHLPDYVERIGAGMEYAWEAEINRIGFAPPPTDGGLGGDDRFDIYLYPISYFGYSDSTGGFIGDNPLTPAFREDRAAFSYMALDNTFAGYARFGLTPFDALDITSAHEFNHSVQYGYDGNEELWLLESTAASIEALLYPQTHDNVGYLIAQADHPDVCLPLVDTTLSLDYHPYSHWYFLKYLTENHPLGEKILPRIWDAARDLDGLFALNAGLDGQLDTYWSHWIIANLARQDCPAGKPYCMNDATLYPPVAIEGRMSPLNWDDYVTYTPPDGVGSYGVDYIDLTPFNATRIPLDLAFVGKTPGVKFAARLVGFTDSPTPEIREIVLTGNPLGGTIQFDAKQYKRLYLTVENHTPVLEANCGRAQGDYTVSVARPGGRTYLDASTLTAPALVIPGDNFTLKLNLRALLQDEPQTALTLALPNAVSLRTAGQFAMINAYTYQWQGALASAPMQFNLVAQLDQAAAPGSAQTITLTLAGSRAPEVLDLTTTIHAPQPLLLVDDAGRAAESESLKTALDSLGLDYDVWRTVEHGSPTAETLAFYSTVIWNTGKTGVETLIADDRAALAAYQGQLILFGTDLAYDQSLVGTRDSQQFLGQVLDAGFDSETYQRTAGDLALTAPDGATYTLTLSDDDVSNITLPDVIFPEPGQARARLTYPDGRSAAIQSNTGRVTLLAFDLSQIGPDDEARLKLVQALLK